jgi:hypothetical protein
MAETILWLLVGGIVGAMISAWYNTLVSQVQSHSRTSRVRKRQTQDASGEVSRRVVQHYIEHGLEGDLYHPLFLGSSKPLAIVTHPSWKIQRAVFPDDAGLVTLDAAVKNIFEVDQRLISKRQRQGVRIFDGEILYASALEDALGGGLSLRLARCSFFSHATVSLRLDRALRRSRGQTEYLEAHFAGAANTLRSPSVPLAVGSACAMVFIAPDGYDYIAIQHRSAEVLAQGNLRSVVPCYGMESNQIGGVVSKYGVLAYNFLREYGEEIFDLEEVVHSVSSRRSSPDWILSLPPIASIESELTSGRTKLYATGVCILPRVGIVSVALLARSTSASFFEEVRAETRANWESIEGGNASPPIEFMRLDDSRIDEWIANQQLGESSSFAIDQARRILRSK